MTIFEQARQCVTRSLIEAMFSSSGAYWEGDEYWTLSPLRGDKKIGSFSINEEGFYNDFASGDKGDFIDLVSKHAGCTKKEAAESIVKAAGGIVRDDKPPVSKKKNRPDPVIPVPAGALKKLNKTTKSDYAKKHHGEAVGGWRYHTAEGGVAFCVVRYNKTDGHKDIIPYYWTGEYWREGQAYKTGRPLYRLHELIKSDLPVLAVEGEPCADVKVPGYMLTTSSGGSLAATKTDWAPLSKRDVTIWPDADESGMKYALAIRNRLPHAKVLKIKGKPQGWDIADCDDPAKFLADCPVYTEAGGALPQKTETDFFNSLSHGTGADVLHLSLHDYIFEPYDRRGNGDFFYRENGTAYYQKTIDPKETARRILEQSIERAFEFSKINNSNGDAKSVYQQWGKALKKAQTRDFLAGVLSLYSEQIIIDTIPRNETHEVLPCLDKIIDFTGKKPVARDPKPGEYFFDPIKLKADQILSAKKTPKYDKFLEQLFPDPETLATARYVLSLMIANKGTKYFVIWYGSLGNNAKNTLMDLMINILGDRAVSLKGAIVLRGGDKSERRFGEIELRGRTAGFFDEVGGSFDIAAIKRLTSLSYIRGENKGEKSVQFLQTWSLHALCNRLPTFFPPDDMAFLSRLIILPFESVFYGDKEDREKYLNRGVKKKHLHPAKDKERLMAELETEKAGILLQLILDYIDLRETLKGKIMESDTCKSTRERYRHDNDLIERFFDDSLTRSEYEFVSNAKLIELYETFSGDKKMTARKLVDILVDRFPFIERKKQSNTRGIKGVDVKGGLYANGS